MKESHKKALATMSGGNESSVITSLKEESQDKDEIIQFMTDNFNETIAELNKEMD